MKTSKKPWPLATVFGIRDSINTNPDYQRPPVWTRGQKRLLIDTILRNYEIPKLYWRVADGQAAKYDVVDGQQRLRTIWGFCEGDFKLPKDSLAIDGHEVAGIGYAELPHDLRIRFDTYSLDIVEIDDADEDEVREMFLRLQNGTSLRAQEKRNAYPGRMRDLVRALAGHPFFERVGFSNSRYTYDLVAAQFMRLEMEGGPTNVKNRDLNHMYRDWRDIEPNADGAKGVRRVLDVLSDVFSEKTPELTRYNAISLYCVTAELRQAYVRSEFEPSLKDWFIGFEARRRDQEELSEDEADSEWVQYKEKISHSTDSKDSIQWRTDFMLRDLLLQHPDISLKDERRTFTPQQRLAIYRRDGGVCQLRLKCDGVELKWDDWHCDHRVPWSEGGTTSVANGQASCAACNLSKGSGQ
jgi:uncharacterized protein DUF262/HNH endonuclease